MNVFYEESGDFKVAAIMSESDANLQIEDARGKRSKIKAVDVRLRFDKITLADFMPQVQAMAEQLDLDFLWEVAGTEEFGFLELAREYYSPNPTALEQAALVVRLHGAPMYFYRKGRGRYKAAPEDNLRAAKSGMEKKAREAALMAEWQRELQAGTLPEALKSHIRTLLHRPDKNTIEWKAVAAAADAAQKSPLRLLAGCGAIPDVETWLLDGFLSEYFPKGTGFPAMELPAAPADLPDAGVRAFSIDDAATTEID
ncbi:MAG: RNB domain-containing ribonuclease, partial [Chitinimonas sp.]|nr:RNB domain-containing ribonuclease [Chitinimonas sp.]